jgi:hypothetical protein
MGKTLLKYAYMNAGTFAGINAGVSTFKSARRLAHIVACRFPEKTLANFHIRTHIVDTLANFHIRTHIVDGACDGNVLHSTCSLTIDLLYVNFPLGLFAVTGKLHRVFYMIAKM